MKINANFSAEHDGKQWVLTETYIGKDKDKNPKEQTREFYYGNLIQVCKKVIDSTAADCEDIKAHMQAMKQAGWLLEGKMEGYWT